MSQDEKIVAATSDVTAALRRTHALMQTELSRSQFAHDTLKESTAALAQLGETYGTLDTILSNSRNLLSTLLKSQKSDTWYLETAFYVLLATIVWLVFRRFVYGPAWWLVWLPLKAFYKAWMGVFAIVGLRGSWPAEAGSQAAVISERPSLAVHNSGTWGTSSQTVIGSRVPSVHVGGGRHEASSTGTQPAGSEGSIIEEVGKIIDESQQGGSGEGQERGNEQVTNEERGGPPNPKKRMWEEDKEAPKEAQRKKDEL
jgi:protein transport protein SEC20